MPQGQTRVFRALDELLPEIMEAMFFAEAVPADDPFGWKDASVIWARIDLVEPMSMGMLLGVPQPLAQELVETVSPQLEATDARQQAMVKELANVLAGRVQIALASEDTETLVGLPSSGHGTPEWIPQNDESRTYVVNDETSLAIALAA